ncbi:MAG: Rieske (2Fe-2S) protein [Candidatus Nanopelagicales bacterium]|jgi:nitrite reductase/ring-hydroxylating ferredoxin subunit|nr:Rieske (2Fe-2S) protein [Candidatus Nanopelagicales bacterium]
MGEQGCGCGGCGCGTGEQPGSTGATPTTTGQRGATGPVSRRAVLGGSAAAVAAIALAGCGGEEPTAASTTPTGGATTSTPSASPTATEDEEAAEASGEPIATVGEFPVGGGKVVSTAAGAVVITQPADGEYLAFDARCPHAGCPVAEVTENTILCTCHGSTFNAGTGERLEGPAPTGLQPVAIVVEGDDILLA